MLCFIGGESSMHPYWTSWEHTVGSMGALGSDIPGFIFIEYIYMEVISLQKWTILLYTRKLLNYSDVTVEIVG